MSDKQYDQSEQFLECHVYLLRTLSEKIFLKWINVQIRHCKKFHCPLSKISVYYQTVIDQRLTVFHKLFNVISDETSKCPITRPSDSLSSFLSPCVLAKNSFTENRPTQLLLRSDHFINPTVWYLVFSLNLMTSILVIISYYKGI